MPASGELIRMMTYVDDIATTLRRIVAGIPFMTEEEKKRLAEYMRKSMAETDTVVQRLEKESK
ncbi:MAG: hypothetical protein ACR2IF_17375 [Terriglobales bacterium]